MSAGSSRGTQWEALRQQVLQRDAYICNYCGRDADTVDHVVAKNNGGLDELSNLVAACRECNGSKQDRQIVRMNWFNPRHLKSL